MKHAMSVPADDATTSKNWEAVSSEGDNPFLNEMWLCDFWIKIVGYLDPPRSQWSIYPHLKTDKEGQIPRKLHFDQLLPTTIIAASSLRG
jgi:hypothetical protein